MKGVTYYYNSLKDSLISREPPPPQRAYPYKRITPQTPQLSTAARNLPFEVVFLIFDRLFTLPEPDSSWGELDYVTLQHFFFFDTLTPLYELALVNHEVLVFVRLCLRDCLIHLVSRMADPAYFKIPESQIWLRDVTAQYSYFLNCLYRLAHRGIGPPRAQRERQCPCVEADLRFGIGFICNWWTEGDTECSQCHLTGTFYADPSQSRTQAFFMESVGIPPAAVRPSRCWMDFANAIRLRKLLAERGGVLAE